MQKQSKIRVVLSVLAVVVTFMLFSCSGQKKYGCPNHMFQPPVQVTTIAL